MVVTCPDLETVLAVARLVEKQLTLTSMLLPLKVAGDLTPTRPMALPTPPRGGTA